MEPTADPGVGLDPVRVDHLLGDPPPWRFPTLLFLAALAMIALLAGTAVLAGREAAGSASLAPPYLSAQPCLVVVALIPAALAVAAGRIALRRRVRSVALRAVVPDQIYYYVS